MSTAHGPWSPLRHRDFAVLWGAGLISNTGSWMHDLAAGWFMTTLDPTPWMVALVQTASTLPVFLFAIPAGTLADRMDRRRLLLTVQCMMLLLAAALALLVHLGKAGTSTLLLFTFGIGVGTAIISPTWQSIIPQLVARTDLQPAIALYGAGVNVSRAIGPALGGVLIAALGIVWPFALNAVSFLAVIAALWWWRPTATANHRSAESFWSALQSGLRHARSNPALRHTLARAVLFYIFASAYWALLPLIAREQLHGGPKLFGILVGCIGAGAVGGALLLPRLRSRWGLERIVHAATLLTTACLAGFALLHAPLAGMLTAVAAGAAWIAALASVNVAAQLAVPDAMRARGMGIYTMVFYGCLASGSLLWGQVATRVHVPTTLLIAASCMALTLIPARHLHLRPE